MSVSRRSLFALTAGAVVAPAAVVAEPERGLAVAWGRNETRHLTADEVRLIRFRFNEAQETLSWVAA